LEGVPRASSEKKEAFEKRIWEREFSKDENRNLFWISSAFAASPRGTQDWREREKGPSERGGMNKKKRRESLWGKGREKKPGSGEWGGITSIQRRGHFRPFAGLPTQIGRDIFDIVANAICQRSLSGAAKQEEGEKKKPDGGKKRAGLCGGCEVMLQPSIEH